MLYLEITKKWPFVREETKAASKVRLKNDTAKRLDEKLTVATPATDCYDPLLLSHEKILNDRNFYASEAVNRTFLCMFADG